LRTRKPYNGGFFNSSASIKNLKAAGIEACLGQIPSDECRLMIMPAPIELIWAVIGLLLTIGGTFLPASVTIPIGLWDDRGLQAYSLGVTYQIGAVLLVGCMGGKNAAALSQIAYLALGLTLWPVFSQGGGIGYLKEASFGYLLGFVPVLGCAAGWLLRLLRGWNLWLLAVCAVCSLFTRSA